MRLLFERSREGQTNDVLPNCDTEQYSFDSSMLRASAPGLPQLAEVDVSRHFSQLAKQAYGVNDGFYPLGSCTMKFNPYMNEKLSALPGFTNIHPEQGDETSQGCLELIARLDEQLQEICGMDAFTLLPAAGAHGEFTGLLLIREYHRANGDLENRTEIIVPDSAHGTNPASAVMAGFKVVNIESNENGCIDLDNLKAACGPNTAGLMLTNPNTVGVFDPNIEEICKIVHEAGGLCYYDGANLNAVMGHARPGDMGFDCVHVNLHKTFSTPHGGGGPGAGPVGCKEALAQFLPGTRVRKNGDAYELYKPEKSFGRIRSYNGNFGVLVRAFAYISMLGAEGISASSEAAVLNANYLMSRLKNDYEMAYPAPCMHEFVMSLEGLEKEIGVSALDIAKRLLDFGIHPPTMYFPLIVHEALMVEPTETETKEVLDEAAEVFLKVLAEAKADPEKMHGAPFECVVARPDEVEAARNPILRYKAEA